MKLDGTTTLVRGVKEGSRLSASEVKRSFWEHGGWLSVLDSSFGEEMCTSSMCDLTKCVSDPCEIPVKLIGDATYFVTLVGMTENEKEVGRFQPLGLQLMK